MTDYSLTFDDRLLMRTQADVCVDVVARWLPRNAHAVDRAATHHAGSDHDAIVIDVVPLDDSAPRIPRDLPAHTASIGSTRLHVVGEDGWIVDNNLIAGHVDLKRARATIAVAQHADITAAMNFAVALLLARIGRYLVHCACVTHPDHGAWLLVGDSRSGKTTTTLSLAHAGWRILSDDHVVLFRDDDAWCAEGWPRLMHVDTGLTESAPTGIRDPLDPAPFLHAAPAAVAGILLPRVTIAAAFTQAVPASAAVALENLVRQTAWSIADPATAPRAFADMAAIARVPAFHLDLALDTFGDGLELARRIEGVIPDLAR